MNNEDNKKRKNAVKAKVAKACMEMEQMKVKIARDDDEITSKDEEDHDNEITSEDDEEDEGHEDDEDNEDDEDHDDHDGEITSEDDKDDDDDDDDDNDDGEAFNNEVEGGVPCAPHSTLINKLHILNQKSFPRNICTGDNPLLGEVITVIKRTKDTKIGKEISIIEVPVDVLEHCGFASFAQNTKAFITSRSETLFGLKNKNGELEMYYIGKKTSKGDGRKAVLLPRRMSGDGPREENKKMLIGRFGLMCFSANRNKLDWDRCECDHINGDCTDDCEENVRWLTPADNKKNYYNKKRARRSHAARA